MYFVYLRYCATHLSLQFKLNSFFSLALFSPGIHKGREKSQPTIICKLRGFSRFFLENYRFCRKSENDVYSRGLSGGEAG